MSDHLIHVPETIEGVSRLLKARKWEKAAIVWAYVHSFENGEVGRGIAVSSDSYGKPYTPESFAHLGIAGLLSKNTVQAYWENWQAAIDAKKAKPVKPGDDITEPNMKWPPTDRDPRAGTPGRHTSKQLTAQQVAAAIKKDPVIAEAALEAIGENDAAEQDLRAVAGGAAPKAEVFIKDEMPNAIDRLADAIGEESNRRGLILEIWHGSKALRGAWEKLASEHRYTGVADEVSQLREASAWLTEIQWGIQSFIVENQDATS